MMAVVLVSEEKNVEPGREELIRDRLNFLKEKVFVNTY